MKWNSQLGGYITGVTADQLKSAPSYDTKSWSDRSWEAKTHAAYGAPDYWEERNWD